MIANSLARYNLKFKLFFLTKEEAETIFSASWGGN